MRAVLKVFSPVNRATVVLIFFEQDCKYRCYLLVCYILYFTLFFIGNKTLHTIIIYTLDMFFREIICKFMTGRMQEVAGRSLLFFFKDGLISCLPGTQWASRPREMKNESFITSWRNGKMGIWWMPPYDFKKNETARISA